MARIDLDTENNFVNLPKNFKEAVINHWNLPSLQMPTCKIFSKEEQKVEQRGTPILNSQYWTKETVAGGEKKRNAIRNH